MSLVRSNKSGHVASLGEILEAYERCLSVVAHADSLLDHLEDVSLVSINSEIAAARSEVNQEVFMVLSGESARIARAMESAIRSILAGAERILTLAMRGIMGSRQYDRLTLAQRDDGSGEHTALEAENLALIDRVRHETAQQLAEVQAAMAEVLEAMQSDRSVLDRLNHKFGTLATYFRIEASRDKDMGGFFLTIAEHLDALHQQIQTVLDRMSGTSLNERRALDLQEAA